MPEPWDNEARDKTTVKRDWRNLWQTVGRLVLSEPGLLHRLHRRTTSFRRGAGEREAEEAVCAKERKEKLPRVTAKQSALKKKNVPHFPVWPAASDDAGRRTEGRQSVRQRGG